MLHYGDRISSEDKVAHKDDDDAERSESKCLRDQGVNLNCCRLNVILVLCQKVHNIVLLGFISGEACSLDDEYTTESIANELLEQVRWSHRIYIFSRIISRIRIDLIDTITPQHKEEFKGEEDDLVNVTSLDYNYWKTLMYLCVTAFTTLVFTLGYYYIEVL